jgi:5-methylcytosine-specific restriction endonuclease McrA
MAETNAFVHEPRHPLTDKQRAKLFLDSGGKCAGPCERKLGPSDVWHADHIIALEAGGDNSPGNFRVLCTWCHAPKTARDHAIAAKGRDIAVASVVPTSQRQGKGRPLPGSRRSAWRKKMDGTVERR